MQTARIYAVKVLNVVLKNKAFIKDIFDNETEFKTVHDLGMAKDLVTGVIKNLYYLDYILSKLSKRPIKDLDLSILNILRIGIYEILYRESKPYAVINEAVNSAKKFSNLGSSKFVNAVLRNFLRNKEELINLNIDNEIELLSIKYSFPKFLIELWKTEFEDDLVPLLEIMNSDANYSFRINTLKIEKEKLIKKLKHSGYELIESKISPDGIIIKNPAGIFESEFFSQGLLYAQAESSMALAENIDYFENMNVLDLCSAPGGKASHIAQKLNNKGRIDCFDISLSKTELIEQNIDRLGIKNIHLGLNDATKYNEQLKNGYDLVICDVPCSGLGLLRKKPEIKIFTNYEDIKSLIKIQKSILKNALLYVKPNGYLIYSTCTLNQLENESLIDHFLKENRQFELVDVFKFDPLKDDTDGFFIAKMRRKDE